MLVGHDVENDGLLDGDNTSAACIQGNGRLTAVSSEDALICFLCFFPDLFIYYLFVSILLSFAFFFASLLSFFLSFFLSFSLSRVSRPIHFQFDITIKVLRFLKTFKPLECMLNNWTSLWHWLTVTAHKISYIVHQIHLISTIARKYQLTYHITCLQLHSGWFVVSDSPTNTNSKSRIYFKNWPQSKLSMILWNVSTYTTLRIIYKWIVQLSDRTVDMKPVTDSRGW